MTSTRPYLRKKAVLIMYKVFLQFPEALRPAFPRLKEKLEDPDTGYMLLLIPRAHIVLSILFCPMLKRCCYCQIMTTRAIVLSRLVIVTVIITVTMQLFCTCLKIVCKCIYITNTISLLRLLLKNIKVLCMVFLFMVLIYMLISQSNAIPKPLNEVDFEKFEIDSVYPHVKYDEILQVYSLLQ